VTGGRRRLVALAATLAPTRAAGLLGRLGRLGDPGRDELVRLAGALAVAPRRARLAALAASLPVHGSAARSGAAPLVSAHPLLRRLELERREGAVAGRAPVRAPAAQARGWPPDPGGRRGTARELPPSMALPFELPGISRGFAALDRGARACGAEAAAAAARAMGEVLGVEVSLTGHPRPVAAASARPSVQLAIELGALPDVALLEVEPLLVARIVSRMSGDAEPAAAATALTPLEASALELVVLAAIDGAAGLERVAERLAPRLVGEATPPPSPLAVDLEVAVGEVRGQARLLLPPAAVAALAEPPGIGGPLADLPLLASLRGGVAPLLAEELGALAPGDVVLADPPPEGRHRLVFPGGLTVVGTLSDGTFHVETTTMETHLAQLPILLDLELARVPLTLSDLSRLVPGAALPIQLDRRGLVTLRIGERSIGRGELVEIEGAVGVRVLSLEVPP
jgi:type III secretion protein Q